MLFLNRGDKLFKVYIEKRGYNSETDCEWVCDFVSVDSEYKTDDFFNEIMIRREKKVLELIKENL